MQRLSDAETIIDAELREKGGSREKTVIDTETLINDFPLFHSEKRSSERETRGLLRENREDYEKRGLQEERR